MSSLLLDPVQFRQPSRVHRQTTTKSPNSLQLHLTLNFLCCGEPLPSFASDRLRLSGMLVYMLYIHVTNLLPVNRISCETIHQLFPFSLLQLFQSFVTTATIKKKVFVLFSTKCGVSVFSKSPHSVPVCV